MLNWLDPHLGTLLPEMALLFALALLISSLGFYRVVYFVSIGYAFAIVAMALVMPIRQVEHLTLILALQNGLLIVWGMRLGIYLVRREARPSYKRELAEVQQRSAGMQWRIKAAIWVGVSLLYVAMYAPGLFGLVTTSFIPTWAMYLVQIAGLALMGGGLVLEWIADRQKSDFKTQFPTHYCDVGLYGWVRCPNYLGEISFWVGNWVMGIVFYDSLFKWIVSLIGIVCIVLIMMGSTKRLEHAQDERYGHQPEYQKYVRTVPVLFPFIPVYTLKNIRVYLE